MATTVNQKYYVALSPDGQQVAIFNSTKFELSTCSIDNLNEPEQFIYKPFQKANINLPNLKWSLSISNKLTNGEILVALSCFSKNGNLMLEYPATLRRASRTLSGLFGSSATNKFEARLERGEMNPTTWIFSKLNKSRIRTTIDELGGMVKFLDSPSKISSQKLSPEIVIVHHCGITKVTIPLSFQYNSSSFYETLSNTFCDKNHLKSIELCFPSTMLKQIGTNTENNPQLKSFYRNIKKNYFFVQNCKLDVLECYNLGSNNGELIKSFQKDSNKQNIKEIPSNAFKSVKINVTFEISKNEKLLAYCNGCNRNNVTLYLMENSLEICSRQFTNIQRIVYIQFICDDEKLLIIGEQVIEKSQQKAKHSKEIEVVKTNAVYSIVPVFVVWDLFSSNSEEDSIKIQRITQDSSNLLNVFKHHRQYASSNGNIIYINHENGTINSLLNHQDLIDILKSSKNNSLKPLPLDIAQESSLKGNLNKHEIYHLNNKLDHHNAEKEVIVNHSEPWMHHKMYTRVSVFLDENKSIQLIIGVYSVQVWKRKLQGEKQSSRLEYIWISDKKIEIQSLSIGKTEFLLEFMLRIEKESLSEKVEENENNLITLHWPYNTLTLRDACVALKYFHIHHNDLVSPKNKLLFDELHIQVQKIVKNFIKNHHIVFKLTDIRYDVMANLIRGNCVSLIKKILFNKAEKFTSTINLRAMSAKTSNHLHFPRLYSWDPNFPKKNDLRVAIESATGVHRKEALIIGYLLDYYSDNAMQNIGWMFTISQALPYLYDYHLDYYVRELFYKPCFGTKQSHIDQSLISPYEKKKSQFKNVYAINIQQGLSKKPSVSRPEKFMYKLSTDKLVDVKKNLKLNLLDMKRHDPSVITNLCVVPLPDFLVYPQDSPKENNSTFLNQYLIWRIIKILFCPRGYIISEESQYSPFLRVLARDNRATLFSNPSLAALVDYKWRTTQSHFLRHSFLYILFALFYSFLTNVIHINDNDKFILRIMNSTFQTIFFYFGYYLLTTEFIQLKHKGFRRYASIYKFFDCVAVIMPISLVISLDFFVPINSDLNSNGVPLRDYTVAISLTTLIMWIELLLLLRFFSGPANYIHISLSIIKRVFYFFIFMFILIVAIAHSMYLLLRSPESINLDPNGQNFVAYSSPPFANLYPNITINETFDVDNVSDNYFSNFWESIAAVYFWTNGRWDQVNQWNFLPVQILCFVASVLLITIMQNMLIAFMTSVFDEARVSGRQAVLKFRAELICDYEALEKVAISRENKENPRYLYYVAKVDEVEHWEDRSKKYRKMHKTILIDRFDSLTDDEDDEKVSSDDGKDRKSERMWENNKENKEDYFENKHDGLDEVFRNVGGSKRIENEDEKLEQKMKDAQNDMQIRMKVMEDKLEQVLQLLKAKF